MHTYVPIIELQIQVGRGFASRPGHTKGHNKNGRNCLPALYAGVRATPLSKWPSDVWNCL